MNKVYTFKIINIVIVLIQIIFAGILTFSIIQTNLTINKVSKQLLEYTRDNRVEIEALQRSVNDVKSLIPTPTPKPSPSLAPLSSE